MSVFMKRDRFPQAKLLYTELEYIQSSGTQCIDTGFYPTHKSRVNMLISDLPAEEGYVFGCRNSSSTGSSTKNIGLFRNATSVYCDYMGKRNFGNISNMTSKFLINMNQNTTNVTNAENGNNLSIVVSGGGNEICPYSLYLFGINSVGTIDTDSGKPSAYKLYACQIYDNGVMVRDYIPVRITRTGEVGLWDNVEKKFYGNIGSGAFVGAEITNPLKYEFLEYIQSTRTQCIDTHFYPTNKSRINMLISDLPAEQGYVLGCRNATYTGGATLNIGLLRNASSVYFDYMGERGYVNISDMAPKMQININQNTTNITKVETGDNLSIVVGDNVEKICPYSLYLFGINSMGSIDTDSGKPSAYKLYACQIYDNGVMVRDYIPVRITRTREVGLWDNVEKKFYGNIGVGVFLPGSVAA